MKFISFTLKAVLEKSTDGQAKNEGDYFSQNEEEREIQLRGPSRTSEEVHMMG